MSHPLVLFADDVMSLTLGKLTIENGTQSVSFQFEGGPYLDVPCDQSGLRLLKLFLAVNGSSAVREGVKNSLFSVYAGSPEIEFAHLLKTRCSDELAEIMEIVEEAVERMEHDPNIPERLVVKTANTGFASNPFE